MGKFYIFTQTLQENALFTGKIYTARKYFTRPPVATVVTNFKSACRRCRRWGWRCDWFDLLLVVGDRDWLIRQRWFARFQPWPWSSWWWWWWRKIKTEQLVGRKKRELLKMAEVQQLERLLRGHHEVAVAIVPLEGGESHIPSSGCCFLNNKQRLNL